ncbi:Icc protein [Mariprofundus micogutta]|uniref:Icc protein n=1 Tax=Mariprofundus micogutta TaxID=1921010 RepID=A0A1L8CK36_9PROT|nr:metallophosphoesterase [Mariprofundus micogutta]GAV19276.1 Icc protein [Mariprofundus micogutta]
MSLILHFSDSHLYADRQGELKGIKPFDSFRAVLAHAYSNYPKPDAIILGGDMAQDESAATYRMVVELMREYDWHAPVMISPGNHANLGILQGNLIPYLKSLFSYSDHLQLESWQVITLNTHEKGSVGGYIAEAELIRLERLLSATVDKPTLVALHHHPVPVGSHWMDSIGLRNRDELWEVVDKFPHVKALLCGHIHQLFDTVHHHVRVLGSPSTCIQFTPKRYDFGMDDISPGYRWLKLESDGKLETGVERVEGFIPPDLNNTDPY